MTLDEIVSRNRQRFPRKPALIMDETTITWEELDQRINRLANAFLEKGLKRGDRVAILLPNSLEYFEIYFAAARAGLISVPLNFRLAITEFIDILKHSQPSLIIINAIYREQIDAAGALYSGDDNLWIIGEDAVAGVEKYRDAVAAASPAIVTGNGKRDDTFAIFYTSGTTGLPKGAMVSHLNLEMNGYNQFVADGSRRDDINLVATPIYHMGAVFMAVTYMMLGCTQVILPKFTPRAWLESLQSTRATTSLLISTMINAVLNEPSFKDYDLSSLRLIFYGGGPMPAAVLERAISELDCNFTQGYGLTETLEATFLVAEDHVYNGNAQRKRRLSSAGREAVGAQVRIIDDDGSDLPAGEVGEILIRSRSVIKGYWRMPEETEKTIRDGWFYTGDMGYLDDERYLFVVDRKKDIVVSGGVNIYTKDIEALLYQHPAVLEAAIIGLADEKWGEAVTAVVVKRPGMDVSEEALITFCKASLPSFKKPQRVYFMDELPKNPSGKILKRALRDIFQNRQQ